jgi:hypothetical protein
MGGLCHQPTFGFLDPVSLCVVSHTVLKLIAPFHPLPACGCLQVCCSELAVSSNRYCCDPSYARCRNNYLRRTVSIQNAAPSPPLLFGRFDMLTLTHPLVADLSPRRHGFDSGSVRVGCAVVRVALLQFSTVSIIPLALHIRSSYHRPYIILAIDNTIKARLLTDVLDRSHRPIYFASLGVSETGLVSLFSLRWE